jgi:putative nucleotidyltransferase with HDIG domain
LSATCFVASLMCGRIRSRTRLVYIGLLAAGVALPTTLGAGTLVGQPAGPALLIDGLWFAGGALLAGLFMTAMLPFLEQWFGIQTDISLLELSDPNHPLLRQLLQRAPGTYNHSINVASIAETAADAIGANGLLCRVGAYFHDIGKMRKPEYFVENQDRNRNLHDDLVPTMSTLVIIAHVRDGVEMARRNHLPKPVIDIIEQHHGTTLVEYFYLQASRASEDRGDTAPVGEADFRYPGPRPQTPEAAVMMLADAVESSTRTLREPTPGRIENLVESICKKKLDDGQFDECSLTLAQLRTIETSLIKSLNAMYHARVKYPTRQQPV